MKITYRSIFLALFFFLLSACSGEIPKVDVINGWSQIPKTTVHYVVQRGDSIYSIAWIFGLDYRQIAADNHIPGPEYKLTLGQKLKIVPPQNSNHTIASSTADVCDHVVEIGKLPPPTPALHEISKGNAIPHSQFSEIEQSSIQSCAGINWTWPAQGKLADDFSAGSLNKGIDIFGKLGSSVRAAAAGKVVYAGNGLRGYGELIIIKHSTEFLSAYGHNQKLLVKEGQRVRAGQLIAKMGATQSGEIMLHFELRKSGKPVDPLIYLPKRSEQTLHSTRTV
jgi:lipoprotein NlpD